MCVLACAGRVGALFRPPPSQGRPVASDGTSAAHRCTFQRQQQAHIQLRAVGFDCSGQSKPLDGWSKPLDRFDQQHLVALKGVRVLMVPPPAAGRVLFVPPHHRSTNARPQPASRHPWHQAQLKPYAKQKKRCVVTPVRFLLAVLLPFLAGPFTHDAAFGASRHWMQSSEESHECVAALHYDAIVCTAAAITTYTYSAALSLAPPSPIGGACHAWTTTAVLRRTPKNSHSCNLVTLARAACRAAHAPSTRVSVPLPAAGALCCSRGRPPRLRPCPPYITFLNAAAAMVMTLVRILGPHPPSL